MLKKRAQGLSITTIIVAVIGLIILVVIIMMITGKLGAFGKGTEEIGNIAKKCEDQAGNTKLISPSANCNSPWHEILSSDSISGEGKCCKSNT